MKTVFCFIAIVVLVSSCSIFKPKIELKKQEFAGDTAQSSIFPLQKMYESLIEAGVGERIEDFEAVEFAFRLSFHNGTPYSNKPVLVNFDDIGMLRIGWTSEEGMILLAFSKEMLNKNPKIIVENNPNILFSSNLTGAIELGVKMKSVDLNALNKIELLPDAYWLDPLLTKDYNKEMNEILKTQRIFIKKFTGLEPIAFGLAIIESADNIVLNPSEIILGGHRIKVFPYPIKIDNITRITATNIHEWTELTLHKYYKSQERLPRFMSDGIAEVIKLEYFKSLGERSQRLLIPDKQAIGNIIKNSRKYWDDANKEGIRGFNIGEWQYGSISYSVLHKSQPLGYSSSMAFWYYAIQNCGSEIVNIVITETLKREKFNNSDVASILAKHNPNIDWNGLINYFPIEKMYWFYEELSKLFGL